MIVRNGKIIKETAFGYKDLKRTIPHEMDDIFRIASMTKAITAVTALSLIEEGKIAMARKLSCISYRKVGIRQWLFPDHSPAYEREWLLG